jgi:heptosyltransferase II
LRVIAAHIKLVAMFRSPQWIVQTSFVGDCVLSLPFLHELARLEEGSELSVIAQPGIQSALFRLALERGLKAQASRFRVLSLDKKGGERSLLGMNRWVKQQIKESQRPETVFCLQRSFRTGLLALLSGATHRVGFSSGAASFLYTRPVRRGWDKGEHEIEKNLDMLRAVFPQARIPAWRGLDKPSLLGAAERPQRSGERAALALGSPWPTKRWPVENAVELCRRWVDQGVEVHLVGDTAARDLADALKLQVPSRLVFDHVAQTGMREWVDLLDSCSVLVSGDSASVHIASDLALPVVALFGPTVPEFGFAPWRTHSRVLQSTELSCRPCSIHGPRECPLTHHKCLKNIGAEQVMRLTKAHLLVDPYAKRL